MSRDRSYDDNEVRAIIRRALEEQPKPGGVSHEDLLSIGTEVGLSSAAVEQAALEVREGRLTSTAKKQIAQRRRRGLAIHALAFLLVNALCLTINFLTTPGEWWALFPIVSWGLGLSLHAIFVFFGGISERRLALARERLGQQESQRANASPVARRRVGVRVQGPLDQIEASNEAATDSPLAPQKR